MKIVHLSSIKSEIVSHLRRDALFPILGSGFSRGCPTTYGIVPSGKEYKNHMIEKICLADSFNSGDKETLENLKFSGVASIYFKEVNKDAQEDYLRKNLTSVQLNDDDDKRNFLSIGWPYIYTLNLDDCIEKNSSYTQIVSSNREINQDFFKDFKCVIKLHGDVYDFLKYKNSTSPILTVTQYVKSIEDNASLLSKLKHDSSYSNLLFIGCSLEDEIDLLHAFSHNENETNLPPQRYYCTVNEPSNVDKALMSDYGITHIVLFDNYDSIYRELYDLWLESQLVNVDDFEKHKYYNFSKLDSSFESNKPYLLHGNSLINKDGTISIPYYFISRSKTNSIISNLKNNPIQLLIGNSCSGRTYVLIDILQRVKAKDVYYLKSSERLNDAACESLLTKKNFLLLADSDTLTQDQIEKLVDSARILQDNNAEIIICSKRNNRDILGVLLSEERAKIPKITIDNKLNSTEIAKLNSLLTSTRAGIFIYPNSTIIDNLINIADKISGKHKYSNCKPSFKSDRSLAVLIILAIKKKIYSREVIDFDIMSEAVDQVRKLTPLVDEEITFSFERDYDDNSPVKYVLNASFWLNAVLGNFATQPQNRQKIISAYKYVISRILLTKGKPDIKKMSDSAYKDYILFDNINEIFYRQNEGGLSLVRDIYEALNEQLSVDAHYMHQRAKCYLRSSFFEKDSSKKHDYLIKAKYDSNIAAQTFQLRYNSSSSEKLLISISHVNFTQAIVLCFLCYENGFSNISENDDALVMTHAALLSQYNDEEYIREKNQRFNYLKTFVTKCVSENSIISESSFFLLSEVFMKIRSLENKLKI